jgi:acyl carrier protein
MDELVQLIQAELPLPFAIAPDTALISGGLVDSFHVTALLQTLEDHYHIRIDPMDVGVDNFDTPEQILRYIRSLA